MDACKSCEAPVKWVRMETGGRMLVNLPAEKRVMIKHDSGGSTGYIVDTYTSHFATCPNADEWRRNNDRG